MTTMKAGLYVLIIMCHFYADLLTLCGVAKILPNDRMSGHKCIMLRLHSGFSALPKVIPQYRGTGLKSETYSFTILKSFLKETFYNCILVILNIMEETIISQTVKTKESIEKALDHLRHELTKIRTGKASPSILLGIQVDYYGNPTPLNQVANVSIADSRTLSIQPWEKSLLGAIEQAIFQANLGLTPMNDGEFVRISIPALTEERRRDLAKQTKGFGEDARVSMRSTRHKLIDFIKNEVKNGYPEDAGKRDEDNADKMTKEGYEQIDKILEAKEADIMKV